jgi:hypothetical protein
MKIHNYDDNHIINYDETGIFLNSVKKNTVDFKGKKQINVNNGGQDKTRVTLGIGGTASGLKLLPFVIFRASPGKTVERYLEKLPIMKKKLLIASVHKNAWIDERTFKIWIDQCYTRYHNTYSARKLLLLEYCDVHLKESCIEKIRQLNTDIVYIPRGCTSVLQPMDALVNKEIKAAKTKKYHDLLLNTNRKKVEKNELLDYILTCWNDLEPSIIIKSFKKTVLKDFDMIETYDDEGNIVFERGLYFDEDLILSDGEESNNIDSSNSYEEFQVDSEEESDNSDHNINYSNEEIEVD